MKNQNKLDDNLSIIMAMAAASMVLALSLLSTSCSKKVSADPQTAELEADGWFREKSIFTGNTHWAKIVNRVTYYLDDTAEYQPKGSFNDVIFACQGAIPTLEDPYKVGYNLDLTRTNWCADGKITPGEITLGNY